MREEKLESHIDRDKQEFRRFCDENRITQSDDNRIPQPNLILVGHVIFASMTHKLRMLASR